MRTKDLFLVFSFFFTLSSIIAQPEDGLVAYYSFDQLALENEVDFYSDGQVRGKPELVNGVKGGAMHFDGKSHQVFFGGTINDYLSGEHAFSLSFYFRSADLQQTRSLMGKRSQCNGSHHFDIRVGRRLIVELSERQHSPLRCRVDIDIPDQQWHHYVVVREPNGLRLYLDGQLVGVNRTAYPVYIADKVPFGININPCKDGDQMKNLAGTLDELRIYRHSLFTEEVWGLYTYLDQEQRQANRLRPKNKIKSTSQIAKIFGDYQSSGSENQAQLQLNPREFTLIINHPESDKQIDQLTLKGRYKIKAGQLLLESGKLELRTMDTIKELPYEGPKIIGDIYGENVTIDLLAFETRLKLTKR